MENPKLSPFGAFVTGVLVAGGAAYAFKGRSSKMTALGTMKKRARKTLRKGQTFSTEWGNEVTVEIPRETMKDLISRRRR